MDVDDSAKAFGEWVHERRELRRLSRAQFAAVAGFSASTLKTIEDGGRITHGQWIPSNRSPKVLVGIAEALGEPLDRVFEAADVPMPAHLRGTLKAPHHRSDDEPLDDQDLAALALASGIDPHTLNKTEKAMLKVVFDGIRASRDTR